LGWWFVAAVGQKLTYFGITDADVRAKKIQYMKTVRLNNDTLL